MTQRRVVVTGLGILCALGLDRPHFWSALERGTSAIGPLDTLDGINPAFSNGALVRDFDATSVFDRQGMDILDRFAQFAVVSARQAITDAGLPNGPEHPERTAVITGSALGGQSSQDEGYRRLYKEGRKRVHPLTIPRVMANAGASHISLELGITGPAFTLSTACSSSSHAIGHAFWLVRQGVVDAALAGGSEAPFCSGHLKAWEAMRVIAPDTCRPFSIDRRGTILGEGGAMLYLETLDSAIERGAPIYAEIVGFGMSSDAHHVTQGSAEGAAAALRAALEDGHLEADDIDYINAHGTGTASNDSTEALAIHRVFGERASRLPVSSTKSMHGHTLGAAGAIEAVATVLTLQQQFAPPTVNFTSADPECELDVIPNTGRRLPVRAALSSSFAFGGLNSVLAFKTHALASP